MTNIPNYNSPFSLDKQRETALQNHEKKLAEEAVAAAKEKAAEIARQAELARRQNIVDKQKEESGFTTSGGAGNYRSDRDHSGPGGYGGSDRASKEARSTELGS